MKQQGRDTSFETRRAVFNLHNLNKRLGDYRGTEAQNFALKNMIGNEEVHRDTMLMKAKGKGKYTFDIPGGSPYDGTGTDPLSAQQSAVNRFSFLKGRQLQNNPYSFQSGTASRQISVSDVPFGGLTQGEASPIFGDVQRAAEAAAGPSTPGQGAFSTSFAALQQHLDPQLLEALGLSKPVVPSNIQQNQAGQITQAGQPISTQQYTQQYGPPVSQPQGLPGALGSAVGAAQADPYANLTNVNGTIYNKTTGVGYPTPEALAKDLGVAPNQIDWKRILPGSKPGDGGQTNVSGQADTTGTSGAEDLYGLGEETPEGILAKKKAEMDKAAADVDTAKEKNTFQETMASAGLAFSGIRDKGEQDLAAANFAKKEGISLGLAGTILKAATAELKRTQGEIREVGNKLIRIKPDGTTETVYEDTSQLTDEQKEELKFKFYQKQLEAGRQSEVEERKVLDSMGLLYKGTDGGGDSDLTRSQQAIKEGDEIMREARKVLSEDKARTGNATDNYYNPELVLQYRDKLANVNPSALDKFYKEFDSKINPIDKVKIGWPTKADDDIESLLGGTGS